MSKVLNSEINIVSFNNPFPPDLGGLIDVYYRIKQLHKAGIKIHLHTFNYDRELDQKELLKYCASLSVYERKKTLINFLSVSPFIVKSRKNYDLLQSLKTNKHPILFEGTHCCAFLDHPALSNRFKIVRMHNVESDYYRELAKSESSFLKRIYYRSEAWKLNRFDKKLANANAIATVSDEDSKHYIEINKGTKLIPSSHQYDAVISKVGKGNFALYHGNLSVPENEQAALYLITEVFSALPDKLIIAGKNPGAKMHAAADKHSNISIVSNPDQDKMNELIEDAQLMVLPTFQGTGLKLKLLYSLFQGRHCLVNEQMLRGTSLEPFCSVAKDAQEMQQKVSELMKLDFDEAALNKRKELEHSPYSNLLSIKAWYKLITTQSL